MNVQDEFTDNDDFYRILDVSYESFDPSTMVKNFKRLIKQNHPDRHPEEKKTFYKDLACKLNRAHDILKDENRKRKYDRFYLRLVKKRERAERNMKDQQIFAQELKMQEEKFSQLKQQIEEEKRLKRVMKEEERKRKEQEFQENIRKEQERQERIQREIFERQERERLEYERRERERIEYERRERERIEYERRERERIEYERREKERVERERRERERFENERRERERRERERRERERREHEKRERERIEKEKKEKEKKNFEEQERKKGNKNGVWKSFVGLFSSEKKETENMIDDYDLALQSQYGIQQEPSIIQNQLSEESQNQNKSSHIEKSIETKEDTAGMPEKVPRLFVSYCTTSHMIRFPTSYKDLETSIKSRFGIKSNVKIYGKEKCLINKDEDINLIYPEDKISVENNYNF